MALVTDSVMKLLRKNEEKGEPNAEQGSKIKSKAGLVINIFAALLAFNMWFQGSLNSKVMNNTIQANDLWNFYQAKSIKQSIAEGQLEDAKDPKRKAELQAKIDRYESDPVKKEGKKELMAKAIAIEAERDDAKKHSPWLTFAGTAYQFGIVLLSASILAVSMPMFWGSLAVSLFGALLMAQGIFLFV